MRKILLSAAVVSTAMAFAANPPQTGFNLIGFNGETSASDANALTYQPGTIEDEEEGLYRFINEAFVVENCAAGFKAVGAEGLSLGFDEANEFGFSNMVNQFSTMAPLADGGPAVNCELPAGTYKVILASFNEDPAEPITWTIMFQNVGGDDADLNYYLIGFDGNDEKSQDNMFIKETSEDGDIYTYPKFYVGECENGFYVANSQNDTLLGLDANFAAFAPAVTDDSPMAFLAADGEAVPCSLTPGYYQVMFASTGVSNMVSFIRCIDQTPADECEYYLLGFNGIDEPAESVKFTRTVETFEYEDEDSGEPLSEELISYKLDNYDIASCANGFTVSTEDGYFSFGLNTMFAAILGDTVTEESPLGFLGIYGEPVKFAMPAGKYNITFSLTGTSGMISFLPAEENAVETIESTEDIPAIYYDLQGRRVNNPSKGIYIIVKGTKAEKVVVK